MCVLQHGRGCLPQRILTHTSTPRLGLCASDRSLVTSSAVFATPAGGLPVWLPLDHHSMPRRGFAALASLLTRGGAWWSSSQAAALCAGGARPPLFNAAPPPLLLPPSLVCRVCQQGQVDCYAWGQSQLWPPVASVDNAFAGCGPPIVEQTVLPLLLAATVAAAAPSVVHTTEPWASGAG